jgi:hypothetical protein
MGVGGATGEDRGGAVGGGGEGRGGIYWGEGGQYAFIHGSMNSSLV